MFSLELACVVTLVFRVNSDNIGDAVEHVDVTVSDRRILVALSSS
jgi:hypothetical protein